MADAATPPKGLGNVNWNDLFKSIYYAVNAQILAMIFFGLKQLLSETPHWPSWAEWQPYVSATVFGIFGYLIGKLGVNNVGQILTANKPVQQIAVETLDKLKEKAIIGTTVEKVIDKI